MFKHSDLIMRTVEEGDLEKMRKLRNDPSTWTMLEHVNFIDAEAQRQWFQKIRSASTDRRYYILCDDQNDFIGIVRSDQIDQANRSIRIGVDIVPELRGKGFGSRAFQLLKKFCFDYLNMHRVWLAVLETNKVALALYKKQGFKKEGIYRSAVFRDGKYLDYIIMSILEDEYRAKRL
ncbi:MAG: GNAT family N-acetyltransferase [Candidatus Omnitrophica bacterium]|nr:GNAT family N-acetyltransferase [Candidatus Omnitrophota bacterium]